MKRIVLVNPPRSHFDRNEIGPPLGLLRLAAIATEAEWHPSIVDFNLLWHTMPSLRNGFLKQASALLLAQDADVYGFTSMAVDSHIALGLAKIVKAEKPSARILLGGTHFSAVAAEMRSQYSWIDAVATGEGEGQLSSFLSESGTESELRRRDPRPDDYRLVDLTPYFGVNTRHLADVESARGCRFRCTFCYSPNHYPTRRSFDIETLQAELSYLKAVGTRHVFFVDDNFLNDQDRALAVCAALREARLGLTWHCYATLPQVNQPVIAAMADAGCRAIFTGIDAIGATSQRQYGKRFSADAEYKLQACIDHGIIPTCAFLLAPPSHPCGEDAEHTVSAALRARELGALVRLNVLTYYPGTKLSPSKEMTFEYDEERVNLELDVPDVVAENLFAMDRPGLFPFHTRYAPADEWRKFTQQVHALFTLIHARTDELSVFAERRNEGLFQLASEILASTGDLLTLDKPRRRFEEVAAFDRLGIHIPQEANT